MIGLGGSQALAHHPMGGVTPANFIHGLLSGIGHPLIGFDHLAAIVMAGCLAALVQRGAVVAVIYVLAMLLGAAVHVQAVGLPAGEFLVALSLIVLGAVVLLARPNFAVAAVLFGCAGVIHGHALGEAIVGAEATPLFAYFGGLALVHCTLIVGIVVLVRQLIAQQLLEPEKVRIAGAVVIGIGLGAVVQQVVQLFGAAA